MPVDVHLCIGERGYTIHSLIFMALYVCMYCIDNYGSIH